MENDGMSKMFVVVVVVVSFKFVSILMTIRLGMRVRFAFINFYYNSICIKSE